MSYEDSMTNDVKHICAVAVPAVEVDRPWKRGDRRKEGVTREADAVRIALDRIRPDHDQPRKEFDDEGLSRLAESMKTLGQLQPIQVYWIEQRGVYVILTGERRWRAAKLAGLAELSCIVHEGELSADDRLEIQLVENALREDLRPIEQAQAFRNLTVKLGLTQSQLADKLQISTAAVSQAMALLGLPAPVRERVDAGELAPSVAYHIAKLEGPDAQAEMADRVVREGLGRDRVVAAVRERRGGSRRKKAAPGTVKLDLVGGITVTVDWGHACDITLVQILEYALEQAKQDALDAARRPA